MKAFKLELSIILSRFLERQIDFPEYIAARDAAFSRAMSRFTEKDTPELRILMMATNDSVVQEMLRRLAADQIEPVVDTQPALPIPPALRLA
jgi:hypothetical protein